MRIEKDLSFLLVPTIYHPLSQLEVPAAFRKPFRQVPPGSVPVSQSLAQLDSLLSNCEFLQAAHLAGGILTSGKLQSTDTKTIFHLLEIRYASLELSGNALLAAQESKSLEDLSSSFYYEDETKKSEIDDETESTRSLPRHIMPFTLRLQALRLQSIGFSDPRRGVSALYDLGFECREHLLSPSLSVEDRTLWARRMTDVGIRVVNALIEMGELDCAKHTLHTMKPADDQDLALWTSRVLLLQLKMGLVSDSLQLVENSKLHEVDRVILNALIDIAEGRYDEVIKALSSVDVSKHNELAAFVKQNLAVAYLYAGELNLSKNIMEELINDHYSFQTLTVNLATIYDLSSDKSRDFKLALADRIANQQDDLIQPRQFTNADFKL